MRSEGTSAGAGVRRALAEGLCGFGGRLSPAPDTAAQAAALAATQHDERLARRIERFAAVPDAAFVWTRDEEHVLWLGRVAGPWRYDGRPEAIAADLVHVRPCAWLEAPIPEHAAPPAVLATFARGGRNWQQTHDTQVSAQSLRFWSDRRDTGS